MLPDEYDLDEQISSTQSAQVWLANDSSGAPVVLKLAASNSRVGRRFKREIDAMRLAAGRHVMPILDFDSSYSWYAMPVATHTLYETAVPASFDACLVVLEAITAALRPIHSRGQVHRDLKPQNILWLEGDPGPRWVVADFGIVRNPAGLTTEQVTRANGLTGSEGWAAPEQHDDAHASTITADVYAAGAILSWMLTARQPTFGHVKYPDEPRLKAILRRATNADSRSRYSSLEELLEAIKDSATTKAASLDSLTQARDWSRVSSYVAEPRRLTQAVEALPKLQLSQVEDWYETDRAGLVSSLSIACDDLRGDTRGLPYPEIDRFLSWMVLVLRTLVNAGEYDTAENVATAVFSATASIHQFRPARVILDWLSGLDQSAQQAMEAALHSSSSWEFFTQQAKDRWKSRGESDLMRRLREES